MYTAANALATIDAFPANNAAVTFVGTASTVYPQNLVYHKNAITLATADLLLPQGVDMASRQVHNGDLDAYRASVRYQQRPYALPCRCAVWFQHHSPTDGLPDLGLTKPPPPSAGAT
jgi:hypothetical protein